MKCFSLGGFKPKFVAKYELILSFPEFPKKLRHFPLLNKGAFPKISPDPPTPHSLLLQCIYSSEGAPSAHVDLSYSQIYPWIRS